jgi:hypothetical protein
MPFINLPRFLLKLTGQFEMISVNESTLDGALRSLISAYPEVGRRIFDDHGNIKHAWTVYIENKEIKFPEDGGASVLETDVISIVPTVA